MLRTSKIVVQSLVRRLGYQIVRLPSRVFEPATTGQPAYERVAPVATYAPWNRDAHFLATYEEVKGHTLVDIYRCWELWTLVEQSAKLQGDIIEIGVWRGGTGAVMAKKAQSCGNDSVVYLCDTFRGVVKAGSNDTHYKGGEHADTSRPEVESLINRLGLRNTRILEGIFPDETACLIEARQCRFRLCHVDVDVYQSAKDIMDWIWQRMVVGGIVVYDDYGFDGCQGITAFVNEQADARDRLVFHNLNGHAMIVKLAH
jgi:O-methyltransferase